MKEIQRQLVRQVLVGDRSAEYQFLRDWAPRIKAWVRHSTSPHAVEDYFQEVLVHLCRNGWFVLSRWNGLESDQAWTPHSLEAFLKTVTRRKVADLWRADQRQLPEGGEFHETPNDPDALGWDPEQVYSDAQKDEIVRQLIGQLPRRDRHLLQLWLQGESDQHTARWLQMTPNNVRQRRHYLLNRLGNQFGPMRGEE